jgi:hypothetical protein
LSGTPLRQVLRRITVATGRHLYLGLVCAGCWAASFDVGEFLRRERQSAGSRASTTPPPVPPSEWAERPAPGHPERLVPMVPLTSVERQLWRQLRS